MQRKSYIQQHPHQEFARGRAPYASLTNIKSTTNRSMDFQSFTEWMRKPNNKTIINHYLIDEDSDERTIYFAKSNKRNQMP